MPNAKSPTVVEAAAQVAATLDGPIAYDEFVQRVLAIHPSRARNPLSQTKSALRYELGRLGLAFADSENKQIAPVRSILSGLTVRHIFAAQEISARRMNLNDNELILLPGSLAPWSHQTTISLHLVDADGAEVKTKFDLVSVEKEGIFGRQSYTRPSLHMPRWLAQHSVRAGDSALLTIVDYDAAQWRIVYEPAAQRREAEIEAANRALADLQVIERDGRMRHDGYMLTYAENRSPWEMMLENLQEEQTPAPASSEPLTPAQENTVYRFKIHPTRNKKLWRRIEVLGGQTLRDLNNFLVGEFKHDWDHMGGFWRLIPRGAGKRMREVELATISPFSSDEDQGADLRLAELDLEPGSQLRWVFDFGASHEYNLLIEDVVDAPVKGAEYPRVVAKNEPRYLYCASCQEQGRQTVATYVCYHCSDHRGATVAFCDECIDEHEDHYYEEIVY